jgi:HSP20 family protein
MTTNVLTQWSALHRKLAGLSAALQAPNEPAGWLPPTDVVEDSHGFVVRMELAGTARADVSVRLEGRALVVEGVRHPPCCAGARFRQLEMEYGPFRRVVPLPDSVAGRRATAVLAEGVLVIALPRSRRPMTKKMMLVVMNS